MSADLLREAAAKMRERAQAPTVDPKPWWPYERHAYWGVWASATRMGRGRQMGTGRTKQQAEHIASWHPAVALAVAGWLDEVAEVLDDNERAPDEAAAVRVARAYLGETS